MEKQHCFECGITTDHYYFHFTTPAMNCNGDWVCLPCEKQAKKEKEKVQKYRDTLSCVKCGELRLGREGGHFDYLDGKNEMYTCRKCFNCEVCGGNLSEAQGRVDYGNHFQLHAHFDCRHK